MKYFNFFIHSHADLIRAIEAMQSDKKIANFFVTSKTLESYYKSVEEENMMEQNGHANGNLNNNNLENDLRKPGSGASTPDLKKKLSMSEIISNLFQKRFLHFKRNYRLMICILVLPVIFEIIAMGFMKIRPPGDYDQSVEFNRSMYPNSVEFYSQEKALPFGEELSKDFDNTCSANDIDCQFFDSSKDSFNWILSTHEDYIQRRYGGISINNSRSLVWYNNKGYHSMPLYLNLLDSAIFRKEMNDSSYNIRTINHPLKLGEDELSVSSM
jgi:hypothetical protein